MADLPQDKRQHKRFKVPLEELVGRLDDDQRVDIIDLSVGGIAIKSGSRLAVGRDYLVRLNARRHSLEVRGTVLWSRIVGNKETPFGQRSPVYVSAMRLQEGSEDRVTDFICDVLLV
ncbi:MAG: PilZ domain-containing protein [Nitrospirae bacterium]|nr:PilZ domain-containing protein [Nitrospirota bacterium]